MAQPPGLSPDDAFRNRLEDIERRLTELSTRPTTIPVLDANPSTDYPCNIWAFPDGKLNVRLKDGTIKQYSPVAPAAPTASNPAAAAQPTTRVGEWAATWSQAYRAAGGYTGGNNDYLYYGNSGSSSYNGTQHSLIGFDYATIAAALLGSQISAVYLYLYNLHTWRNSGATCYAGIHNNASKPGTYTGAVRDFVSSFHTNDGGAGASEWHQISNEFGSRLRDGSGRGVILQAPNSSTSYYGYAAGFGSGLPIPILKIVYIK